MNNRVGQELGNYRLVQLLGRGGFAEVYLAEHNYLKRKAAIKILSGELTNKHVEDFLQEAQTIAALKHPHILPILDFGIDAMTPFLVMDYAPNGTLRSRHPYGSQVPLPTVVSYVRHIAEALQYAHNARTIHRDIKPENILLDAEDSLLLSDFGIAAVAHSTTSMETLNVTGTPHYMSPEQFQGKPVVASDQYALAVVVYEWFCGQRPYRGDSFFAIATQHASAPVPLLRIYNPDLSRDIEHVVRTALAKDPKQRFASVSAFATALEQAVSPSSASTTQTLKQQQTKPTSQVSSSLPQPLSPLLQESAKSQTSQSFPVIKRGDVVEGAIVRIDQDEILVDIGLKSEGVLSTKELNASGYGSFNELHLHEKVLVYVIWPETSEGQAILSLKRANTERLWRIAEDHYANGDLLMARVIDHNNGGLIVDVYGIRGFVPMSQVLDLKRENVAAMRDKELPLKIIEIDRQRSRLVLSERLAWKQHRYKQQLNQLQPGEIRQGVISNLVNNGAIVDLDGAEILIPIREIAWSHIKHPGEVLKVGQKVDVMVLDIDIEKEKITLSLKRTKPDPWSTIQQRYNSGQTVIGMVTKIKPTGISVRIEDGIEGNINNEDMKLPLGTVLSENMHLVLRIENIDIKNKIIDLKMS